MRKLTGAVIAGVLAIALSCSSDPEGPVSEKFLDDGSFGVRAGEEHRVVIPVTARTVSVPVGVGTSKLLWLGDYQGIRYGAVLLRFDFTVPAEERAKVVSSATLHLPLVATPFTLKATFNELDSIPGLPNGDFSDTTKITTIPPYNSEAIRDSLGNVVRTLNDTLTTEFDLEASIVGGWISGNRAHHGIVVLLAEEPASNGLTEMYAHERAQDPPAIRVVFTDGARDTFATVADYTVATLHEPGLHCTGGIATRVFFTFSVGALPERALVHGAFLKVRLIGTEGLGATQMEIEDLGFSKSFTYELYAPNSIDTLNAEFRNGYGVDLGSFVPTDTVTISMPLRGYIGDILDGTRRNTGLVLQSSESQETSRIQKASFFSSGGDAPRIEIVYSLPADFRGTP